MSCIILSSSRLLWAGRRAEVIKREIVRLAGRHREAQEWPKLPARLRDMAQAGMVWADSATTHKCR